MFSASTVEATKTELSDNGDDTYTLVWKSGDAISVNSYTLGIQTTNQPDGYGLGYTKANFAGPYNPPAGSSTPQYKAYYPASIWGNPPSLPLEQHYVDGNIDGFPMYAESDEKSFEFHNLCGIIRIGLKGDTRSISSITLVDVDDTPKPLSGQFDVESYTAVMRSGSNGTSLICSPAVALNADSFTYFNITAPAASYGKLKIMIEATDGYVWTLTSKNPIIVTRSQITPINLSSPKFKNEKTQITYTTYNNTKLSNEKYKGGASASFFGDGLTIQSHTFENNVGTITLDGEVTRIGDDAFNAQSAIVSITIPSTVTSIGKQAFDGLSRMTTCNIPSGVTTIGYWAFRGCAQFDAAGMLDNVTEFGSLSFSGSGLSGDLVLSADVTMVDNNAFKETSVRSVTFKGTPSTLGTGLFQQCASLEEVVFESNITIPSNMFDRCTSLSSVTFGGGCSYIGQYAFNRCYALTSFTFPENLATLSGNSFIDCTGLLSIVLPTNSTFHEISDSAFNGCTHLVSANIPANVTRVGNYAFQNCGFTSLPEGWGRSGITWGMRPFYGCPISSITFPDNWTSIPDQFCWGWKQLEEVNLGSGITAIGHNVFRECTSLTDGSKVVIPSQVASIGSYCFGFSGLTSLPSGINRSGITLSDHVFASTPITSADISAWTSVPNSTFSDCTSLASVTLGEGLTSIAQYGFSGCTSLSSISLPTTLSSIGPRAFQNSGLTALPAGFRGDITLSDYVFSGTKITSISLPDGLTSIPSCAFSGCTLLTTADLNDVKQLKGSAFSSCSSLQTVIGPDVLTISDGVFQNCSSLTSVSLPTATTIGGNAFNGCTSLETISLPSATTLNSAALNGCSLLRSVSLPVASTLGERVLQNCPMLESLSLPALVSTGWGLVYGCTHLETVDLGSSVTTIAADCFRNTSSLTSLTIRATTPPSLSNNLTASGTFTATIYVPAAYINDYKEAPIWSNYAGLITAIVE